MNQPSKGMESRNLRVIVLSFFFFFSWSRDHLWLTARNALEPAPAHGAWAALCLHLAMKRTAQLNHPTDFSPDWWSLRWKGNPLKGRQWGLKEWIPKLKAWMKYMRSTYISGGNSQPQMHFNLELFYFYSYFPTFPMSRGRRELHHPHTIPSTWLMSKILLWS